jgi:hypothetical protein
MKYKGLALTTAVAMTASLFAVPVHAADVEITISEVDVTGDLTCEDGKDITFGGTFTVKTDNDEKITLGSAFTEYWQQTEKNWLSTITAAVETGNKAMQDDNQKDYPLLTKYASPNYYWYKISGTVTPASGYTIKMPDMTKPAKQNGIAVKLNGQTMTNAYAIIQHVSGTDYTVVFETEALPTTKAAEKPAVDPGVPMYRLYNPNSGEHFYTSSTEEKEIDVAAGWNYEGVGWVAPSTGTPVMRMYNPVAGEHHYTTNKDEADYLVTQGWNLESDCAWYSAPAETGIPVYREYNPNQFAWNHNYTPSAEENKLLIDAGWAFEGVSWYAIGL